MSRAEKTHPPLKADFSRVLGAVAMGSGKGKKVAAESQRAPVKPAELKARSASGPMKKP